MELFIYLFLALYIITNVNAALLLYYVLPMYQEYKIKIIIIINIIREYTRV